MKSNKKKKGYALLATIILVFFMSALVLTSFTIVNRYTVNLNKAKTELRERVS